MQIKNSIILPILGLVLPVGFYLIIASLKETFIYLK